VVGTWLVICGLGSNVSFKLNIYTLRCLIKQVGLCVSDVAMFEGWKSWTCFFILW
jgi:hypothetical protein